jgi:hypothetical protein
MCALQCGGREEKNSTEETKSEKQKKEKRKKKGKREPKATIGSLAPLKTFIHHVGGRERGARAEKSPSRKKRKEEKKPRKKEKRVQNTSLGPGEPVKRTQQLNYLNSAGRAWLGSLLYAASSRRRSFFKREKKKKKKRKEEFKPSPRDESHACRTCRCDQCCEQEWVCPQGNYTPASSSKHQERPPPARQEPFPPE